METPLISEDLFKQNGPVTSNTDVTDLVPYIGIVQKMYIKPILGQELYRELQTQINAANVSPAPDPNPITVANRALLVEIAPALSFYAVYQGLPFHWASLVNKGLTIRKSENSEAIGIEDLALLRRWVKDDAERLAHDLRRFLCGCAETYPLWSPDPGYGCPDGMGNCDGRGDDYGKPADFGIYIPRRRRGCR